MIWWYGVIHFFVSLWHEKLQCIVGLVAFERVYDLYLYGMRYFNVWLFAFERVGLWLLKESDWFLLLYFIDVYLYLYDLYLYGMRYFIVWLVAFERVGLWLDVMEWWFFFCISLWLVSLWHEIFQCMIGCIWKGWTMVGCYGVMVHGSNLTFHSIQSQLSQYCSVPIELFNATKRWNCNFQYIDAFRNSQANMPSHHNMLSKRNLAPKSVSI